MSNESMVIDVGMECVWFSFVFHGRAGPSRRGLDKGDADLSKRSSTWLNFGYLYAARGHLEHALTAIARGLSYDQWCSAPLFLKANGNYGRSISGINRPC